MKKIKEVIERYKDKIFELENVVGVGCGYKQVGNRFTDKESIVVLVEEKLSEDELSTEHIVPQNIEDQETDVIEVGKVELLATNDEVRTTGIRPAQPGISIGHHKITAGTFGAVVKDNKTEEKLILSNNHVLANISNGKDGKAKQGDRILQPGSYDGGTVDNDIIGYLERFIPIHNQSANYCPFISGVERVVGGLSSIFNLPYRVKPVILENKVDCAVAKPKSEDLITEEVLGLGVVNGVAEAKLGMKVKKSGRTSGITTARIKAINATINVQLSEEETALFTDQIVTEPFSQPGDSGAVVLNSKNQVVGLLFAGSQKSSVCNNIKNVIKALNIEF
ncbi:MAG: hypothetical protein ACQERJ_05330 [Bacillota bacterium]